MSGASSLDPGRFPTPSDRRLEPRATWGVRRRQGRKCYDWMWAVGVHTVGRPLTRWGFASRPSGPESSGEVLMKSRCVSRPIAASLLHSMARAWRHRTRSLVLVAHLCFGRWGSDASTLHCQEPLTSLVAAVRTLLQALTLQTPGTFQAGDDTGDVPVQVRRGSGSSGLRVRVRGVVATIRSAVSFRARVDRCSLMLKVWGWVIR